MKRALFLTLCLSLAALFAGLGGWQIQRVGWKQHRIALLNARLASPPAPPPPFDGWSANDAYSPAIASGEFLLGKTVFVQAVTERGPGWWVMTPLQTATGFIWTNRGFIPNELRRSFEGQTGTLSVIQFHGLLRASEPKGAFLRSNSPEQGRWFSRDIQAMTSARKLDGAVAPYFIDAATTANLGEYPVGGLTITKLSNNHLLYSLTWFGLSFLSLLGAVLVWRSTIYNDQSDRERIA